MGNNLTHFPLLISISSSFIVHKYTGRSESKLGEIIFSNGCEIIRLLPSGKQTISGLVLNSSL